MSPSPLDPEVSGHVCFLSRPGERETAGLASFIGDGLHGGERCIWFGGPDGLLRVASLLDGTGIDVPASVTRGDLRFNAFPDGGSGPGPFRPQEVLDRLSRDIEAARADGCRGIRAIFAMEQMAGRGRAPHEARAPGTPGPDNAGDSFISREALLEWEELLEQLVARDAPGSGSPSLTILCWYGRTSFGARLQEEVLRLHPGLLLHGQPHPNPYYLPPALRYGASPDDLLDGMLARADQLTVRRSALREEERWHRRLVEAVPDVTANRSEKTLIASERRFRALFENSSDGLALVSGEGVLVYAGPSTERILGYSPEELLGRDVRKLIHPDDRDPVMQRLGEVAAGTRETESSSYRVRHKDGSWRWIEVTGTNLLNEPSVQAIVVNYRDVTARNEAEESLRAVTRHARCILWTAEVADRQGTLRWQGDVTDLDAAQTILPLDVAPGGSYTGAWYESRLPEDRQRMDAYSHIAVHSGKPSYSQEYRCFDRFGREHWMHEEVAIQALGPGHWRVFGVTTPITERKRLEAELRQRLTELGAADRRKDEFIALLAHELRNPLAPLLNAVHLLRTRLPDDAAVARIQQVMERQIRQMSRLIDDLLDLSRISQGKMALRPALVDLVALVRDAVEDHRDTLRAAGLGLDVDLPEVPVILDADRVRIAQVVGNILGNAAKFTDAGGRVAVRMAVEFEHGQAVISISDTGIGIAPGLLPRLFEPFVQGPTDQERGRGGMGLGLALVQGLVRLHGGEVSARSEGPGHGSEFIVRLPLDLPALGTEDLMPLE